MSQTSLPPLYKRTQSAFEAPFAYYKPGKAPASFARAADVGKLAEEGQLGFQYIPLKKSEDDRPTAQTLNLHAAALLLVAYSIEGFEPNAASNLSLERSGPFRVINKDNGSEIAKGNYTYDELLRQHKVGETVLPQGVKLTRYAYIYMNGEVYRLKLNSTLERGIELAVKRAYERDGLKVNRVYVTQLCQEQHFWLLYHLRDKNDKPAFIQITKDGNRVNDGYNGDIYFMPHLTAAFVNDASLIERIKSLREQIRASFLQPRHANELPQIDATLDERTVIPTALNSDDDKADDLPF